MPSFTNEKVNDINLDIKASEVSTSGGYIQQNSVYVDDIVYFSIVQISSPSH